MYNKNLRKLTILIHKGKYVSQRKQFWVSLLGLMGDTHVFQLTCFLDQNQVCRPVALTAEEDTVILSPEFSVQGGLFQLSALFRAAPAAESCLDYVKPFQGDPDWMTDLCRPGLSRSTRNNTDRTC